MNVVLITGATGFLGGRLAQYLRTQGYGVLAMGRSKSKCAALVENGLTTVCHDLSIPVPDTAFCGREISAIVHCAALSAPYGKLADFERANVSGTRNIVAFARRRNVRRLVNISSPSVYFSPRDQIDIDENTPLPRPINAYAKTKAQAEAFVLAQPDIGAINLRPRGIYGAGDQTILPRLLHAAKRPFPILRNGRARIDLTHVHDVCRAIDAALRADKKAEGETFNISSGEALPIREIVDAACARAHKSVRWRRVPFSIVWAAARTLETAYAISPTCKEPWITSYGVALFAFEQSLNIDKAAAILGWHPMVQFGAGLEEAFGSEL